MEESALPFRRIYQATIVQAIRDAAGIGLGGIPRHHAELIQHRARNWLDAADPDFIEVCEWAGFDPCIVKDCARDFIKSQRSMPRIRQSPQSKRAPKEFQQYGTRT